MNPHTYLQQMMDKLSVAHGHVMEECLNGGWKYKGHSIVREVIGREVIQASVEQNEWRAGLHTVNYPPLTRLRRRRIAKV